MSQVVLDGALVPRDEARVAACDRGLLYGEGLFETVLVRDGRPRRLDWHRERLAGSARTLGLPSPPSVERLADEVALLVGAMGEDGLARLTWTAGALPAGPYAAGPRTAPRRLWTWRPRPASSGELRLVAVVYRPGELAAHKTLARWPYARATAAARAVGADDALLVDADGYALETPSACVVARVGEALVTPPLDGRILPGIGRRALLADRPVDERPLRVAEVDALFVVGASTDGELRRARLVDGA